MLFSIKIKVFSLILLFISLFLFFSPVEAAETTPRIFDREIVERLTRIEEGQKALQREMDKRFEQVDKWLAQIERRFDSIEKQFDRLINIFLGIIAAFAGIVAVTIGFAIWDRKTTLKPAMEKAEKLENVLRRCRERAKACGGAEEFRPSLK